MYQKGGNMDDIPGWILAGIALYQLGKTECKEYKERKQKAPQRKPRKRKRRKGK